MSGMETKRTFQVITWKRSFMESKATGVRSISDGKSGRNLVNIQRVSQIMCMNMISTNIKLLMPEKFTDNSMCHR